MTIQYQPYRPPILPKLSVTITPANRPQLRHIAALEHDDMTDPRGYMESCGEWSNLWRMAGCGCRVARHKGLVVGAVGFLVPRHEPIYEIVRLVVGSDFRRMGIGRAIMGDLAQHLRPHQRTSIEVIVPEDKGDVVRFFAACGFRGESVERGFYSEGEQDIDGWVMRYRKGATK